MQNIGADYLGKGRCGFGVFAPLLENLSLHMVSARDRLLPLEKDIQGCFHLIAEDIRPGDRYVYRIRDSLERPDPASYYQPEDVMGPSCVIDHLAFQWDDRHWQGIPIEEMIIYELHVGTFTKEGTFDGVLTRLPYLQDLGINAVEIMPVAQFPGTRNWGYDGVYPFAVQHSYGGPDGLKKLINACHMRHISVILDVVYNHLGPEGNFLPDYMPCFTDTYKTPWGKAINFDDAYSHGVRRFFVQNALYWFEHYHIDALRLDAVHGIFDRSAKHILMELSEEVDKYSRVCGRKRYLIAESDLNDVRVITPRLENGYGMDAQWNDDFHHCLHTLLTGETQGYYEDFGTIKQMAKAINEGFVYAWDYAAYRKRYHGSSSAGIPHTRFVVFSQNHDQIGNRMKGERLSALVSWDALKIAAGLVLLSNNIPLLFMGEEYGEDAPFLYFMSFHDMALIKAVREGRKKEFASFNWQGEPDDPCAETTFLKSKLQWEKMKINRSGALRAFYKRLIQIRRDHPVFHHADKKTSITRAGQEKQVLSIIHLNRDKGLCVVVNFDKRNVSCKPIEIAGEWQKVLDSSDTKWLGSGFNTPEVIGNGSELLLKPLGFIVYERKR